MGWGRSPGPLLFLPPSYTLFYYCSWPPSKFLRFLLWPGNSRRQSLTFYDQGDRLENADAQIPGEGKAAGGVGEFPGDLFLFECSCPCERTRKPSAYESEKKSGLGPFSSCREKIRGCALGTSCQEPGHSAPKPGEGSSYPGETEPEMLIWLLQSPASHLSFTFLLVL